VSTLLAWPGAPLALASAALFGASTPLAKLLLGEGVDAWLLAGLLYLGSGLGLSAVHLGRGLLNVPAPEAPLRRGDLPWLSLVVLAGGIIGPVLLMVGLARTPASSAALLLNLEGLATMIIAWVVFKENVDRRLLTGAPPYSLCAHVCGHEPAVPSVYTLIPTRRDRRNGCGCGTGCL